MNSIGTRIIVVACLAAPLCLTPVVRAQGPLTPPGAPGETMKTLAQVEPRIPVFSSPVMLSQPGSYYLTTNLSGTVTIAANNVTLDLMGFSIVASSGNAVELSGTPKNVRVHNGILSSSAGSGIAFGGSLSNANGVVENLRVNDSYTGIQVCSGYTVRNCHVYGASYVGIVVYGSSVVRDCWVEGCGMGLYLPGTGALLENNIVKGNANNYNIFPGNRLNLLLCEVPQSFGQPCSVKFAGTLTMAGPGNGITVYASDVTIDLAGHALVGPGTTSGHGIYQDAGSRNLRVMNGKVVGWCGAGATGINVLGAASVLTGLQACTNRTGMMTGLGSIVSGCTVYHNGYYGIWVGPDSTVSECSSVGNGADGFYVLPGGTVSGCTAVQNAGNGFQIENSCTVSGCVANHNAVSGFSAGSSMISSCKAEFNAGDGIYVADNCVVSRCTSVTNGFGGGFCAGIYVDGKNNRIEENTMTENYIGLAVFAAGNFIARNIAFNNSLINWHIVADNICLVVKAITGGAISGESGGVSPGSTDPNANYTR